jgi:hypothetical protein
MYEIEYWCPNQGRWLRVEGPDYGDLTQAAYAANHYAATTGRTMRVVDWTGRAVYRV